MTGVVSVRGTCAGIEHASGEWFVLQWPENARQGEGQGAPTLRIADELVTVGARARLGGGWAEGESASFDDVRDARVTDRCPSSRYFMVSEVVIEPER